MAEAEEIYKQYYDKVYRYVRSKVSDPQETEDLAASVFVKVCQNLSRFDGQKASVSTWVYTITRNTVIDYFRKTKFQAQWQDGIAQEPDPAGQLPGGELLEELAAALEQLGQRERDLVILHYYYNRTLKEIAAQMQISYSSTKRLHEKALAMLRKSLQG